MEHVCGRAFRPNSFGKANTLTMQHWQNLNVLQLTCGEDGFGDPAWLVEGGLLTRALQGPGSLY